VTPGDTRGHRNSRGHQGTPGDTRGHQGTPGDTRGHWGTLGHQGTPGDTGGHLDTRGHRGTPGDIGTPGACTIKLFTAIIYEIFVIRKNVCPWQSFPA
jgi:hypothetical protein